MVSFKVSVGAASVDKPLPTKLTGDINKLRQYVNSKFKVPEKPTKRRFKTKQPDVHGVFAAGKFVKSCLRKPAASVQTSQATSDGWTVNTLTRKSGIGAGKTYFTYKSPSGEVFASYKQATAAGYTVS